MLRTRNLAAAVTVIAGVALTLAAAAQAAVSVKLGPTGKLDRGAVVVRVQVACSADKEVLEANVSVSQDDGAVSEMGAIAGIVCDGKRRWYEATVTPFDGAFHRGRAFASAFVLLIDPDTEETEQDQDARRIVIPR